MFAAAAAVFAIAREARCEELPADPTAAAAHADALLPATAPLRPHSLLSIDWHGQLRLRGEALGGVRVNADNPSLPVHLDWRHGTADKPSQPADGRMNGADLRARLEPVIAVGDWSAIYAQIDGAALLADSAEKAVAVQRFAAGSLGTWPLQSAVGVRRLWLKFKIAGLAEFEAGRTPDHFGMGMLRHAGGGLDDDHQSDVDRVRIKAEVFGFRVSLARSNLASYPVGGYGTAFGNYNTAVGHQLAGSTGLEFTPGAGNSGLALQDSSDVIRWEIEGGGGKFSNGKGLVWDVALLWLSQDLALRSENTGTADQPDATAKNRDPDCGTACVLLGHRALRSYTFQGAADWRTDLLGSALRLQAEAAFIYGTVVRTDITTAPDSKTIVSGGAALKADWQRGSDRVKADLGVATGETDGGFGVNDTTNFKAGGLPDGAGRAMLTGFRFHRSFRVDGLLFRDLIGAVANAYYVRPAYEKSLWRRDNSALSVEAGVLGAAAMFGGATPGKSYWMAVEPELALRWAAGSSLLQARGSYVQPFSAFANPGGVPADPAWRGDLIWRLTF